MCPRGSDMGLLTVLTDVLAAGFVASVALSMHRGKITPGRRIIPAVIALALAWALMWSCFPALSETRWAAPPRGQAGAVLGSTIVLSAVMTWAALRDESRQFTTLALRFSGWRIVFGLALLVSGLRGDLPAAFFWPVARGDIAVGTLALALSKQRSGTGNPALIAWNILGLADLFAALVLGVSVLRPAMASGETYTPPNLLPLVAVPLFIAMHLGGITAIVHGITSNASSERKHR